MLANRRNRSFFWIILVIGFTVCCAFSITRLRFDYDFEAFFPNEAEELNEYNEFRNTFEYDNEFFLLAIENKSGIFDSVFLARVHDFSEDLRSLKDVKSVMTPLNLKELRIGALGPIQTNLFHYENPGLYKDDSIKIYNSPEYLGSFFAKNAKSICFYVRTEDKLSKLRSDSLSHRVIRTFEKYGFDEVHYAGRIVAQEEYLLKLSKEFTLFLALAFVVVVLFLTLTFRSVYGVVVPVIIVSLSIFWTLAIMVMVGKSIDIMTVMLPTMIFIAGMSDVVHYFSKYFEEYNKGTEKEKIFDLIKKEVGFPTFLTLLTTVVGFLSLLFSSIKPIRDFGIFTSVGIIIAFILTYTLLPSLLYFFTPKKMVSVHRPDNTTNNRMRFLLFWIFRNQKIILVATLGILVLSFIGINKIKLNNLLLEDLSNHTKIKRDFLFFDENYSGVRPFELKITVKDSSKRVWDYEVLQEINKIEEYGKLKFNLGLVFSPATIMKGLNKSQYDGDPKYYKFPDKEDFPELIKYLKSNRNNAEIKKIMTRDGMQCRIAGKYKDYGSMRVKELNEDLLTYIKKNINQNLVEVKITGGATLLDKNNEYMVNNMIQGFAWSIVVIALLTFLLHRSLKMVIVFILPNFIPMLIIAGFMGFCGIELKAATSLIFSIAFGIATDDTIHFISRLKIELGYGKSMLYAFKRTYFETGRPIILTTFILIGGFMSLMLSDFQSVFYFGFLICLTIIVALAAEFFLLPILLLLIMGNKNVKK